MKIRISSIIIFSFLISCNKGEFKEDYSNYFIKSISIDYYNLKGQVKSIKTNIFNAKKEKNELMKLQPIKGNSFLFNNNSELQFYNNGIISKKISYDLNGKTKERTIYNYNQNGRIRSIILPNEKVEFTYSSFDSISKIVKRIEPNYIRIINFKYGENKRKTERLDIVNDSLVLNYIFKYDKYNNEVFCDKIISDSELPFIINRKYDSNKNIVNETLERKDSMVTGIRTLYISYKYNEKNELIIKENRNYKLTNNYFDNGVLHESKENYKNGPFMFHSYNRKGDLIKEYDLNQKKDTVHILKNKYNYDNIGNWTRKVVYVKNYGNEEFINIIERKIEYY